MKHKMLFAALLVLHSLGSVAQVVTPWMTTGDKRHLLEEQKGTSFGNFYPTTENIEIDATTYFQTVEGFGYTFTEGSAQALLSLPTDKRRKVLHEIFNPYIGMGSSVVRIGIGATDLSSYVYSYDDTYGDTQLAQFSLNGPDRRTLIPLLRQILTINPNIKIIATPWSAPAWMKHPSSNTLMTQFYAAYAQYFVRYIEAMKKEGIPIWAITPQNEPGNIYNQPAMGMSAAEQLTFINYHLGPALNKAGYGHIRIICYDHNCDNTDYPIFVSKHSNYVDGAAFHLYAGDISALSKYHHATRKNVYFTEQYTHSEGNFRDDLLWHLKEVLIGSMNHYSKIAMEWNLANFSDYTPHTQGGCTQCKGALTCDRKGNYTRNVAYYTIAQVSKFVQPGAQRIACHSQQTPATAFRNPDGSIVLVTINEHRDEAQPISVHVGDKQFSYTLPKSSAITFVWRPRKNIVPLIETAQAETPAASTW